MFLTFEAWEGAWSAGFGDGSSLVGCDPASLPSSASAPERKEKLLQLTIAPAFMFSLRGLVSALVMLCTHSSSVLGLPKLLLLSTEILSTQQNPYIGWWLSIPSQFLNNIQKTRLGESENHKMAWFGRYLKNYFTPISLPWVGTPSTRPGFLEPCPTWLWNSYRAHCQAELTWWEKSFYPEIGFYLPTLKKSILLAAAGTEYYARKTSDLISATNFMLNKT